MTESLIPMGSDDNQALSERYRLAALAWVDAEAAASLLEDTKSAVLAEKMQSYPDISVNKAETSVKASPEWRDHIEKIVAARKTANRLKVQMEFIKMKFFERNSSEATARTEMKMGGR